MARSSLCVLALAAFVALCLAQGQDEECFKQVHQHMECMRKTMCQQHQQSSASGPRKQAFEKCFTDNGCTAPHHPTPHGCDGPKGQGKGKGRGGRHSAGGKSKSGEKNDCLKTVFNQTAEQFQQCLQQKGVNLPHGGPHHGQPHHGPPHHGPPHGKFIAKLCGNDTAKADQVNACLTALPKPAPPTKEQAKAKFDAMCAAEAQCKQNASISDACKVKLQTVGKAMCECGQQLKPQFEQIFKQACPNKQLPPPPPNAAQHHDCSKPMKSPCEEGFDAVYAKFSHGPPPPPPQ